MVDGRIVIAEDDEDLRAALVFYLERKGYKVTAVGDGGAALDEMLRNPCDLLITDLVMSGMGGVELISILKDTPLKDPPAIIVMTGLDKGDTTVKAIKAGVSFFLRKPLIMDELEAAVSTALDRRRLDNELKTQYAELDRKVEARTRELRLINRFSYLVNGSFDLGGIMADAVAYITQSMEADAAWIFLLEGEPPTLTLKASKGIPDGLCQKISRIDITEGYTGRTFREGGAFIYNQLPGDSVPIGETVAHFGFKSAMHAAIKSGESVLGSMGVASLTGRDFQESHLQLLASFGNQIGLAIEKVSLYEKEKAASRDLQKKVNQLVILNELGSMLRVSRTLDEAARSVAVSVAQGLGFDTACIWLVDDESSCITLAASQGIPGAQVGASVPLEEMELPAMAASTENAQDTARGLCESLGCALPREGLPLRCTATVPLIVRNPNHRDMSCWEHFGCSEKDCPAYLNSLACWIVEDSCVRKLRNSGTLLDKIELCRGCEVYNANRMGRIIGVMCVERSGPAGSITADDTKTLGVYANSIAASLENIRLMERLVKDERFIDSILFNMSSGLMVTDNYGFIRMINYAGSSILRIEHSDLLGRNIVEIFPEASRFITVEESHIGHEVVINTPEGPVPVGYTNSSLIEHDGVSDGVIVVFRDLSDIKKLQDDMREADRFAAIGKVAAGVAHEIRNPLFGITSVAQILARETNEDSPHKALIDAMLSETSRLNTLVEEMLLYGRSTKAVLAPTDMHALMDGVLEFHVSAITAKGIKLVKEFMPDMPPLAVDPHQMRQVFLNILYNAIDAVHQGGEIRLATAMSDSRFVVKISDSGIGIPREELPKVFDLFFTTKEKGTGLGLAICRKIVEDHGGTISLSSALGKGTAVEISIPANA